METMFKSILGIVLIVVGAYLVYRSVRTKPFTFNDVSLITGGLILVLIGSFLAFAAIR